MCIDTLIFCDAKKEEVETLNYILRWFKACSGLKINYEMCELIGIRLDSSSLNAFVVVFGCKVGNLPSKYLGLPLYMGLSKRGFMGSCCGEKT